jgi:hypothetical protein
VTASVAAGHPLDAPLRLLAGVADTAATAAIGRPVRLRVGVSADSLRRARTDRVAVTIRDLQVAGLDLASVRVVARGARIVPGWPPRLRAGSVEVRATVTQAALDRWLLSDALPVRLRLRDGGMSLRTGAGGLRLAELAAGVIIDDGRLIVVPGRAQVLGVTVPALAIRFALPLPPLPRSSRLSSLVILDGAAVVGIRITEVDEPITTEAARAFARLVRHS